MTEFDDLVANDADARQSRNGQDSRNAAEQAVRADSAASYVFRNESELYHDLRRYYFTLRETKQRSWIDKQSKPPQRIMLGALEGLPADRAIGIINGAILSFENQRQHVSGPIATVQGSAVYRGAGDHVTTEWVRAAVQHTQTTSWTAERQGIPAVQSEHKIFPVAGEALLRRTDKLESHSEFRPILEELARRCNDRGRRLISFPTDPEQVDDGRVMRSRISSRLDFDLERQSYVRKHYVGDATDFILHVALREMGPRPAVPDARWLDQKIGQELDELGFLAKHGLIRSEIVLASGHEWWISYSTRRRRVDFGYPRKNVRLTPGERRIRSTVHRGTLKGRQHLYGTLRLLAEARAEGRTLTLPAEHFSVSSRGAD